MTSVSSFIHNNYNKLKDFGASFFGIGVIGKVASDNAQYLHKMSTDRDRRREIRRNNCRKDVRDIKMRKLDVEEEQVELDSVSTNFTLSSLDDNQSRDNIIQDLKVTGCVTRREEVVLVTGKNAHVWNNLPVMPSNFNGFLLAVQNKDTGEVRLFNNPLQLTLPIERTVSSNASPTSTTAGPSTSSTANPPSGFASITSTSSTPNSGFASINRGFFNRNEEYIVTTYNPTTNQTTTETIEGKNLFKGKKVIFQGEEIIINEQGLIENVKGINENVQDKIQGVNPNFTSTFTPYEGRNSTNAAFGPILLQLVLIFVFGVPILEYFQKMFRERFFENKEASENEEKITSNQSLEKIKLKSNQNAE